MTPPTRLPGLESSSGPISPARSLVLGADHVVEHSNLVRWVGR